MQTKNSNNSINLVDLFFYLLAHWYWFLLCILLCVGFAYYRYSKMQHEYRSDATIVIKDPSNARATVQLNTYSNMINRVSMSNEILELQSRQLMMDVVRALDADIDYTVRNRLRKVELYDEAPVKVCLTGSEPDRMQFLLEATPIDMTTVELADSFGSVQAVNLGDTVVIENNLLVVKPTIHYRDYLNKTITIRKIPAANAAAFFLSRLKVLQTEVDGTILQLSLQDYSHRRANDILNTLVDKYNENALREKNRIAVNTAAFINERLLIIQGELGDVEDSLALFKSQQRIMNADEAASNYLAESRYLNTEIIQVESKISMALFLRDYLVRSFQTFESIPINTGLGDAIIDDAIRDYNKLASQRKRLIDASSPDSPAVKQVTSLIEPMQKDILGSIDNLIRTLTVRKDGLSIRDRESIRKFSTMPTKARELLSIERQQKIKETLYMFLLNKREENALTQAMADNNARMIDAATASWTPVYPKRNKMLALAFLVGLLIPGVILIARLLVDTKVRSHREIEESTSMPFLAEIPLVKEKKKKNEKTLGTAYTQSQSKGFIEAMRLLCTNIEYMRPQGCQHPVLATTSFHVAAGKTFVTLNIAACLADAQKKVVLLDLDLRKRVISGMFNLKHNVKGISNFIYDESLRIDDILHPKILPGVDFLPAGHTPPNPTELLNRQRFDQLIEQLKTRYDYVLLDGVPIHMVADTMIIQRQVDMNLFIVRSGQTDRRILPDLEDIYKNGRLKAPCIILNGTEYKKAYGYAYGYGYGYNYGYGYGDHEK